MTPRVRIKWSELSDAKVGVWGLGVEGRANLRKLTALGNTAVLVEDDDSRVTASKDPPVLFGREGFDALLQCEVVVKSPGISRYRPEVAELQAGGVKVVGGLGLWLEEAPLDRVACITGTKGKSTTTAVAGYLLERMNYRCMVGGNIGIPPWDPAAGDSFDYWIVETSSFQATDITVSPAVVAVTTLHPDHIDWHGDTDSYFNDKLSACTQPGPHVTVANAQSSLVVERRELLGERVRWVDPGLTGSSARDERWIDNLMLRGEAGRANALIAQAVLQELGVQDAYDVEALARASVGFQPLRSRQESLGTVEGVEFVDDSLATNVISAIAALDAFDDRRIAVILGGYDRGIDYRPLADRICERTLPTFVVTLPDNGTRIGSEIEAVAEDRVQVVNEGDLACAVRAAFEWSRPGGVVLLSPAAPSFGAFRDYRERSEAFREAMRACEDRDRIERG
ncbi:MAG: UDP-N-acetylmuramoyl-L-alanine--D-glutamate ligase [Acidimicrobiales bacterium]|jgi:UDP-N-acetylmuramoylalanine--D-glutamate ligase